MIRNTHVASPAFIALTLLGGCGTQTVPEATPSATAAEGRQIFRVDTFDLKSPATTVALLRTGRAHRSSSRPRTAWLL